MNQRRTEEIAKRAAMTRFAAVLSIAIAAVLGAAGPAALAHGDASALEEQSQEQSAHHHMMRDEATRSTAEYAIPQIKLVRADGKNVWLADEINDGRPVVMDFIYTTCTSICPISSQTLADLQKKLGAASKGVHLVSISIDPENDTPARLREYAKKFNAGSEWQYYTGTIQASVATQVAFNVYRGDKMSHTPVTLIRRAASESWVRIDGFATAEQLLRELRDAMASAGEGDVH